MQECAPKRDQPGIVAEQQRVLSIIGRQGTEILPVGGIERGLDVAEGVGDEGALLYVCCEGRIVVRYPEREEGGVYAC